MTYGKQKVVRTLEVKVAPETLDPEGE